MSAVQDSRRDALFGRDAELARVRDAASSRGAQSQSLLITGPAGIGKTALVEAAIDGMDAEVLRLTGSPLGQSRPFETAINGIATFEQSDTFEPIKGQIAQIIANAHAAQPTPVEVARTLISLMRTLPPREHATVVIFQDIHLYDEHTLQALAFFARQNHLYDQAYLMTARSGFELASFQGVDQLRLGPLPDQAAREALSHWADMIVPLSVAVSLNAASGGIPLILREIAATLCPAQLRGDFALPVLPTVTTAIRQCLGETLERLSTEQLRALAVFGLRPTVPQEVAAAVVPQAVKDDLLEQHILTGLAHALRVEHAALGWAAWQQLLPPARSALTLELAHAWSDVNDVTAAYYQALEGPLEQDSLTRVRKALDSGTRQEDPELSERVAEVAFRSRAQSRTADRLRWVTACLEAHHLGAAVEACKVAAAGQHGGDETFAVLRMRGLLGGLTGDPALALPTPTDTAVIAGLPPKDAFTAWTLAARSALRAGAVRQARRYLDRGQVLARAADVPSRALWRLADAECHVAAGTPVHEEGYLEALSRWCDYHGGQSWYDDATAVATLADLGEHDAARQFLVTTEAAHAEVSGLAQLCLLAARLHVDLAQCEVAAARATAEQVGLNAISPLLHAPALRADLLRLHVLTGWTGPAYEMVAERLAQSSDSAVSAVRGLQGLIDGHYSRAVAHLRSAVVAQRASPAERWELLADLVEAYLASGDRSAAAAVVAAEKLGDPRSLAAIAARDRVRALLAPPLEARDAFAKALDVAGPPLPLAYRARAGLAYARRLEQLGFGADADAQRGEAADLFGQQGLVGWQRHADQLVRHAEASPATSHFLDELSDAEQRVVRLLVQGRQNRRIAEELFVSLRTVEKLLTSIYRKAGVASKSALLAKLESLDE